HFLRQLRPNEAQIEFDDTVRDYLIGRAYPGNIRDLKQVISRISYHHVGRGPITAGDLPADERPEAEPGPRGWCDGSFDAAVRREVTMGVSLKEISQAAADAAVRIATEDENGNLRRAARRLGITDRALQMRRAAQRERIKGHDVRTA